MKTKNDAPVKFLAGKAVDPILTLYFQINHLKQLYRQGWLRKGNDVPEKSCESVAEHCFGMTLLALFVCDLYFSTLDRTKVVLMCLIHELGEIIHGDPRATEDCVEKELKYQRERSAIISLLKDFPNSSEYLSLWEEFEKNKSPEARLVKQLDKLEMALQSKIYTMQYGNNLQEFLDHIRPYLESEDLKRILDQVEAI